MQVTLPIDPEALRFAVRDEVASFIRDALRAEIAETVRERCAEYISENIEYIAGKIFESKTWDVAKDDAYDPDSIADDVVRSLSGKSLTVTVD